MHGRLERAIAITQKNPETRAAHHQIQFAIPIEITHRDGCGCADCVVVRLTPESAIPVAQHQGDLIFHQHRHGHVRFPIAVEISNRQRCRRVWQAVDGTLRKAAVFLVQDYRDR